MIDIDKYMKDRLTRDKITVLDSIIRLDFPKIKNLLVTEKDDKTLSVTFDEGEYTSQQILSKVNSYKDCAKKLKRI